MLRSPPIIILYKILARYRSSRNKYAQVVVLGTVSNKGKNQKYEAVGTAPKYNRQIVEICKIDTSNSQIHDNSLKLQAWYIHFSKRGEVRLISCAKHFSIRDYGKLALWARTFLLSEMIRS
jgi:hypothetical protein